MDQKMMKIIAIVLGALCLLALIFAFSYVTKYNSLENEYKRLESTNSALSQERDNWIQKATNTKAELDKIKERQTVIEEDLNKANSLRDELSKKLDEMTKQRDALMEKLQKALSSASQDAQKIVQQTGGSSEVDEYWAGILRDKSNLEVQVLNLKDAIKTMQIKSEELLRDKASLELDIQKISKEKDEIQRNLEYNEKLSDNLSMQLYREKEDKRKLQAQWNIFKEENYSLRSRLKEAMNNKITLEKKLRDTEDKRVELYNRLSQMDQVLQDKISSIFETKRAVSDIKDAAESNTSVSTIELSPIVVRSQQEETKSTAPYYSSEAVNSYNMPGVNALMGKILNVNDENNFVIIDIGDNRGVNKGMIFGVYRGQNQIATIEVIQTKANASAADIKEKSSNIKVGDIVK